MVIEFFSVFEILTILNSPTFPSFTIPEISERIETPLGILASKSSITLGRPEVISDETKNQIIADLHKYKFLLFRNDGTHI